MADVDGGSPAEKREIENMSSSSDSDSDDEIKDYSEEIKELNDKLATNIYDYNSHKRLVEVLHRSGELELLRAARESFSKQFPLAPEMWVQWIKDEKTIGSPNSEIEALFERALSDYVSFDIWLEYVQWACNLEQHKCRDIFERAITAVGLEPTSGGILWETYRVFEQALLANICSKVAIEPTAELEAEMHKQKRRVVEIFERHLKIPLAGLEDVYDEYVEFLDGESPEKAVGDRYKECLKQLPAILENESHLEHEGEVKKFIEFEKQNKDPSRIQLAYERAVTKYPLRSDLWTEYLVWLDMDFKMRDIIVKVYARAVRNISWDAGIWKRYLLALERAECHIDKIEHVFAASLEAGFTGVYEAIQLWINYIFVVKRYCQKKEGDAITKYAPVCEAFERAKQYLIGYYDKDWDPECTVRKIWARFAFEYCNDATVGGECWREIMAEGYARYADYWIEYAALQKVWDVDVATRRKGYYKALNSVSDFPDKIAYALIQFEREEGSVYDLDTAEQRVSAQLKRFGQRLGGQKKNRQRDRYQQDDRPAKYKNNDTYKKDKQENGEKVFHGKGGKASFFEKNDKVEQKREGNPVERKRKAENPEFGENVENSGDGSDQIQKKMKDNDGFAVPNLPPPPPPAKGKPVVKKEGEKVDLKDTVQPTASKELTAPPDFQRAHAEEHAQTNARTVFVANLEYSLEEDKLRRMFEPLGEIEEIRMPKKEGAKKHKGFAYVQFVNSDPVDEALKLDRAPMDGRPMFVSRCKPPEVFGAGTAFKFGTGMQKNKLFVKNLSFSATKEQLKTLFEPFGQLKDIRVVTYKNGASKGLCFVEFENDEDASRALVKTDETMFMGKRLSVAISNPPPRAAKSGTAESAAGSHKPVSGLKQEDFMTRGKGASSKLQMVPRNLATKSKQIDVTNGAAAKKLSNQQFREMLMKK